MQWFENLALQVIERNPEKEEYVCATGISPSGSIHIGNFRDIATSYFVVKALRKLGKKARLMHSWDEFDRLRKIPVNVAEIADGMERYIGAPYIDVPNPFPDEKELPTYAAHFEAEFSESLSEFGISPDYRHQADMYRSGKYTDEILLALKERGRIFDILDSFRTQEAGEGERESYYPVSIYCPECLRDTTTILSYDDDTNVAQYQCKCGHCGTFNFREEHNCKLAWKVDWAMRWRYEGVDFEPGGQDHAAPTGSYQTSKVIAREIFGYEAPIFQGYGFIGLKGATGKMSGSSGLNLTPATLLKIYEPELILWLYAKTDPLHSFDFCFDDGILRQYTEFDRVYNKVLDKTANDSENAIMYNCMIEGKKVSTVSMSWLVQFGSVVNFNPDVLEAVFEKLGTPYKKAEFEQRLNLAKNWLEMCSPESVNRLCTRRNWEAFDTFSDFEKKEIEILHNNLSANAYDLEELNTMIYAIPEQACGHPIEEKKEKRKLQAAFFNSVYSLLIGKKNGPRLYLFLYALEPEQYLKLLDFSYPKTEEELAAEAAEAAAAEETTDEPAQEAFAEEITVQPVKAQIEIDDFKKLDLRVCEIVKCQEIRKSHNCYKLTLNDGAGERVIVSSIKHDYTPEALIGKKVIVIVNLKPARITGVTSEGMLLAAADDNGSCAVLFADSKLPNGIQLN